MSRQLGTYHPVFGYHFIPDLKARVEHEGGGYLIRTNSLGFRSDHEFEREKRPGSFRILLFGDSFTAGMGVSNRDRYGEALETLAPGLEVFNFAIPGSGPDTQYLVYQTLAREIEHDLVVIAVWVQNIRRIVARYRSQQVDGDEVVWAPKPYFTLTEHGDLELHNSPVPRDPVRAEELPEEERRFLNALIGHNAGARLSPAVKGVVRKLTRYETLPGYRDPSSPDWRLLKAILNAWTAELRVPAIIMPIPLDRHLEGTLSPRNYQRRYMELDDPPRVVVHDPLIDLGSLPLAERRSFRFERDAHPTPAYHRALAESLAGPVRTIMSGVAA